MMQYYNERLPCPKCGKDDEAEVKARYIPRFEHPVNKQDTAQARCKVHCECGCEMDVGCDYLVFGIKEACKKKQIENILRQVCEEFYKEVATKGAK